MYPLFCIIDYGCTDTFIKVGKFKIALNPSLSQNPPSRRNSMYIKPGREQNLMNLRWSKTFALPRRISRLLITNMNFRAYRFTAMTVSIKTRNE